MRICDLSSDLCSSVRAGHQPKQHRRHREGEHEAVQPAHRPLVEHAHPAGEVSGEDDREQRDDGVEDAGQARPPDGPATSSGRRVGASTRGWPRTGPWNPGLRRPVALLQENERRGPAMLWRSSKLTDNRIEATDGTIGRVADLLFSDDSWMVRWLAVDTGGWLTGRQVLLPASCLGRPDGEQGRIPVELTREP